jgi:hypothetical protein
MSCLSRTQAKVRLRTFWVDSYDKQLFQLHGLVISEHFRYSPGKTYDQNAPRISKLSTMAAEVGLGLSPEANTAKAGGVLVV